MHTQSESGGQIIKLRNTTIAFVRSHRVLTIATASTAIAIAVAIPYASASDTLDDTVPKQQNGNPAELINDTNAAHQTEATPQGATKNSIQNQTNVTVNGQKVEVPANGSYSNTTHDGATKTEVNVDSTQSSSGDNASGSNSSSVEINVHSESRSSHSSSSD